MGSIFDEMQKLKKQIQGDQPDPVPQLITHTEIFTAALGVSVCPKCGLKFASEALKKHLLREHGVTLRSDKIVSSSSRIDRTTSGKNTQDQTKKPGLPLQPRQQQPHSNSSRKNNRHAQKIDGLDRNKSLDGYIEQVVKLPNGESHRIFVKRSDQQVELQKSTLVGKRGITANLSNVPPPAGKPSVKQNIGTLAASVQHSKHSFKLSSEDDFKSHDQWVEDGINTTLCVQGKPIPIYMGIDFGTAFTKASIGFGHNDIFIVDWAGTKMGEDIFTLPGEFSVLQDGACILGRSPNAIRVATNLKLPFLDGSASKNSLIDATIFLALVMKYIRGWWFYHHKQLAIAQSIEWYVNLGVPTTPWQINELRSNYEKAAKAAWVMSCSDKGVSVKQAEQYIEKIISTTPPIEIVPEFVAQIASYTRSPQRQPDLHLLVDVGAGTVDVVTFNVHQNKDTGEDIFPIFSASVSNQGTHYLMSRRLQAVPGVTSDSWNDATAVPSSCDFAEKLSGVSSYLR